MSLRKMLGGCLPCPARRRAYVAAALVLGWVALAPVASFGQAQGQAERRPLGLRVDGREVAAVPQAYIAEGRLWLPARAVLEAMGAQWQWDEEKKALVARIPGREVVFAEGQAVAMLNGRPVASDFPPHIEEGKLFVPARLFAQTLNCALALREANTVAEVTSRWEKCQVAVREILTWPRYLSGKEIIVEGEYRGWRARGEEGEHLRHGPPKRRSDWIVKDATGAIYVSGRSPRGLDPYDDIGATVRVEGVGALSERGVPFIEARAVVILSRPGAPQAKH